jgi:uncharacterized membrane protein YciS (DUF1049 family)
MGELFMATLVVLFLLCGIIYFVLSLFEKIDRQKREIKRLKLEHNWEMFGQQLELTQAYVQLAIEQCKKLNS